MKKIHKAMTTLYVKALSSISEFKRSERGDTNFISMLLIIGIVVVLAGLFLTLGRTVMDTISTKIQVFISGLNP